ncbi:MAG TPA: glycerol-3-phosphate dehydrogenase/oxidase [Smithellaceae bacterium]|nr:glycerol-3-phosphate dehydrogenase/oxidase [Smithellaceae bacterium]HRS89947.1 glycerol-3-phosphate dehydrogenase/oxidase [Smithellaceae bacterium]HRV26783.1 glycerol-3-phosphate dehydrogenase/oxidase [Smithellaceae bacterium]
MHRFIENYRSEYFDVIVIGGGITGASVAYEAASRGLRVALLEKKDFSWATSAVTSKLIHGGLRYLANGEVRLVRESLRERRVLENIAPNFIYPMPMMMTHYTRSWRNNKHVAKVGMILYDLLSYDKSFTWDQEKKIPSHKTISGEEVLRLEPCVRKQGLTGASVFYDCLSIFPERLTLAFIKSAAARRASVANYARVEEFLIKDKNNVTGVVVRDLLDNKVHKIHGTVTINCAGPWADIILGLAQSRGSVCKTLRRSEGIHVITEKKMLSGKYVIGCMTQEGRHFFLIPWRAHTLIGTTDKAYIGDPDEYRVTKQSIMELIDEVNRSFGDGKFSYADVKHTYGGLRPLVEDQTCETYTASRRYEIFDNEKNGLNGLITVEGGKYTTSRNLAENCLRLVMAKLKRPVRESITDKIYLAGSEINKLDSFFSSFKKSYTDFSDATLDYLSRNYGTESYEVLRLARGDDILREVLNQDGEIMAQVAYAIRKEMAKTLCDIVTRRTGIGTLGHPGDEILAKVADIAAKELKWDKNKTEQEIANVKKILRLPD